MILARLVAPSAIALGLVAPALAHDGPPYPIFVDEDVGGWTVSVWADPDVGTGTFYYYVTAPPGLAVDDLRIRVHSSPADASAPAVEGTSELAAPGAPYQQLGTLEFAHRGTWPTRFVFCAAETDSVVFGELARDLEVTPPGLGPFYLLWYAIPFAALGAIWLRGLLAQRAYDRAHESCSTPPSAP